MVVFRDDRGVKVPLFDSQVHCDQEGEKEPTTTRSLCDLRSSERLEQSTNSCGCTETCSTGWRPGRKRPPLTRRPGSSSDMELLGEMMFGSMPIKVAGSSSQSSLNQRPSFIPAVSMFLFLVLAVPFQLPPTAQPPPPHTPPHTITLPPAVLGHLTSSSFTCRIQRSRSTSLENASELYRKVLKPLDQQSRKGKKFAIRVIVCLSELKEQEMKHFQDFFFSHFTLIDAHLEQLKEGVEDACHNRGAFTAMVVKAPVWLSLVSHADSRRAVCTQFLEELALAIVELDTKETKFFLSSLLTAVLSHHLAWVFTVSRSSGENGRLIKTASSKSLAVLAESHPYNPLWA